MADDAAENFLLIESVRALLTRIGAKQAELSSTSLSHLLVARSSFNLSKTGQLVVRVAPQEKKQRMASLVARLQQATEMSDETKSKMLRVIYGLNGAAIKTQPGSTLDTVRTTRGLTNGAKARLSGGKASSKNAAPKEAESIPGMKHMVPMPQFINQMLYTMQGVPTTQLSEEGELKGVPHGSCHAAAEQIEEVGKLQQSIKHDLGKRASKSLLCQSLQFGLRGHMQEYDLRVARLMGESKAHKLTLPRLLLEADKAAMELGYLRWMQLATDTLTAGWGKGGVLAANIESFMHHAAAPVGLFKSLRDATYRPLLHMLCQWVLEGVLVDPHEEFFIARARDKDVGPDSDNWWEAKHTLRETMLPPFVTPDLARDILLAGKSIIFLRKLCNDPFHMPPSVLAMVPPEGGSALRPEQVPDLVRAARKVVDARVLEVMFDEYRLPEHLFAARSFGLLAQGDFFEGLYIGKLGQLLRCEYQEVVRRRYQLAPAVEECVQKTPVAATLNIDPSRYLEARLTGEDTDSAESAVDKLVLFYQCPQPLRTVLRSRHLDTYYKPIFSFLWRLRRYQKELTIGRLEFKQVLHARCHHSMTSAPPDWWMKLHCAAETASQVAHAMLQFVSALASYTLVDGVDVLWKLFEKKAKEASTLDAVIACHSEALQALHQHLLLDPQHSELKSCVEAVLGVVSQYLLQIQKLHRLGHDLLLRLQDGVDVSKAGGTWLAPTTASMLSLSETHVAVVSLRRRYIQEVSQLLQTLDRGLDPAVSRDTSSVQLSPRSLAKISQASRAQQKQVSMGSLQRLRTVLDFSKFFTKEEIPTEPIGSQ